PRAVGGNMPAHPGHWIAKPLPNPRGRELEMQEIEVGTYVDAMTEVRVGQHGVTGCKKNVAAMLDMPRGAAIHDEVKGVVAGTRHVCIVPEGPVLRARLVND